MANRNLKEDTNISDRYSRRLINGKVTATAGIRNPHTLEMVYGAGANRIEVLRALEKQNIFKIIWYVVFFLLGIVCLILEPKSWVYVIDLYVMMVNIDLVSDGKLSGVYIGILECFLYAYICYVSGLYGEVIKMFAINVPVNIFTVITWTKNLREQKKVSYSQKSESEEKSGEKSVVIRKLSPKSFIWLAIIFAVLYVGCYFGLQLLNTSALIFSAACLTLTIFQKILSALRYKENWLFSIISYIISIAMWLEVIIVSSSTGINLIELPGLVAAFACLTNGFYGWAIWKSMYRKIAVNGGEVLAIRKVKINRIIKLRRRYQKLVWDKKIDISKNS